MSSSDIFWRSCVFLSCLLLLNFSPIKPAGYPLTLAPVIIPFLAFYIARFNPSFRLVGIFFLFSALILLKSLVDILMYHVDLVGLFRTWSLIQFFLFSLIIIALPINNLELLGRALKFTLVVFVALTVIIVTTQLALYFMLGDISVFRVWGGMGYSEQSYVLKSIEHGRVRSNGLYFEPSFLALVMFSSMSSIMILQKTIFSTDNRSYIVIILLSFFVVYLSGSRAGLSSVLLLLLLPIVERIGLSRFVLAFSMLVILLFSLDGVLVGSDDSLYYRLVAPLEIIAVSLREYVIGVPFGSMESFILSVGVLNGSELGQTLDNGWYLMAFYFGWGGVILMFLAFLVATYFFAFGDAAQRILIVYLMLAPMFTGAVFSPEFFILLYMVCISYRLKVEL